MKTLKRFFRLARPYWGRRQNWGVWLLLIAVLACSLTIVHISVRINTWEKRFYDALEQFNADIMPALILHYLFYLMLIAALAAGGSYLRKFLLMHWREHLTQHIQQCWLYQHNHYRLQWHNGPDNPDQRIAEDIYLLAEKSIDLCKNFVMKSAKLGAFITVLWHLSGVHTFTLYGYHITIHGYLVWIALLYSVLCTFITHLIGHKLQHLNIERQHREADYRANLLRLREHSEQIALYNGEHNENTRLNKHFSAIKHNWHALIQRELKLEIFTATYLRINIFIPILATLPMYLARRITFGDMMQARGAFSNVQDGFAWFMDYYKNLMEWAAIIERLARFTDALETLSPPTPSSHQETKHALAPSPHSPRTATVHLSVRHLNIHTANGRLLLQQLNLEAQAGEWILLDGDSGIGKTSLIRTLAGIWPHYQGYYNLQGQTLVLPQQPYLPQDTLRAILSYPQHNHMDDRHLQNALYHTGLEKRIHQLDDNQPWYRILSGGEQQRLSLARALLYRPSILLMDEATSHLDDPTATTLLHTIQNQLPHALCLGISHQNSVKEHFHRRLDLNAHRADRTTDSL
ncbi:MAG: ABC transporter ATP-binding protein/permease [Cardiobacteriaceae bacterium]|nr:ABC transporter ATP-binding protein/permease [Cardiobacteriaceae bacterium]